MNLREIVEESLTEHTGDAEQAGVELSIDFGFSLVVVSGDKTFLARLPGNLIGNAIRHTPAEGHVHISVAIDGKKAVLTVADTGSGIPVEDQPRIFERFYRADKAQSRDSGGCGLGPAICKSVAEAHRGTINLSPHLADGSQFVVRFRQRTVG